MASSVVNINNSATGGPLLPAAAPAPLEGQALNRFLQQWLVGVGNLPPKLTFPRWQAEPPDIPQNATAWQAFGITARRADTFPAESFDADTGTTLLRNEELDLLCSFYDTGTNGEADANAAFLRDGLLIPQNLEPLFIRGMGLVDVGPLVALPTLVKLRWLYRVDMRVTVRRMVERVYPVLTVLSADVGLVAEGSGPPDFTREIVVTTPAPS